MRKTFEQILKSAKVNYIDEYKKLYKFLFEKTIEWDRFEFKSCYELFEVDFPSFYMRGTCLTLQEFDAKYGFSFPDPAKNHVQIDDLVLLMEYLYNLLLAYQCANHGSLLSEFWLNQIIRVGDAIGYELISKDDCYIFVKNDAMAHNVAESELIPEEFSPKIITYNHHSMRGNIEGKKAILIKFASILEGKRRDLEKVNAAFANDLFYIFNNFNIRHNNCDDSAKGKYKSYIAKMKEDDLEKWYDETYQMCLLAFMEIEQAERKPRFDALKAEIEK